MAKDQEELFFVHVAVEKGYLGKGTVEYALAEQRQSESRGSALSLIDYFRDQGILTAQQIQEIRKFCQNTLSTRNVPEPDNFPPHDSSEELEIEEVADLSTSITNVERNKIAVGDTFAHYAILEELGHGGMGKVFKVRDTKLERIVALKVISTSSAVSGRRIRRFLQEAKATARLEHPNIVKVFEVGDTPEYYFTMEYLDGPTLTSMLRKQPLKPVYAASIVLKIADALHVAHKNNIIHRDIKPSNIMLDKSREPKLMDFGLSKMIDADNDLSKTGEALGTPVYMAPEQANNKDIVDCKSDVYSLGATLYEMITGQPIFQGDSFFDILNQVFHDTPTAPREINPEIPKDLEAICLKCLEKKPQRRYTTARALARDLKNFTERKMVMARPSSPLVKLHKLMLRYRIFLYVVLSLCCIFFAAYGGYAMGQKSENDTTANPQSEKQPDTSPAEEIKVVAPDIPQQQHTLSSAKGFLYEGIIAKSQGKYQQAREYFVQAIQLAENLPDAYFFLGELSLVEGKLDEAEQHLNNAIALNLRAEKRIDVHKTLGFILLQRKNYSRAAGSFFSASQEGDQESWYFLGKCYFNQGEYEQAKDAFSKADLHLAIRSSEVPNLFFYLGSIAFQQQDYAQARYNFQLCLALHPMHPKLAQIKAQLRYIHKQGKQ